MPTSHLAVTDKTGPHPLPYCGGQSCEVAVRRAVALLAPRWAVPVLELLYLGGAPMRFKDLQRHVGGVSAKELTRQLAAFVRHGLVRRCVAEQAGVRIAYELLPAGHALVGQMAALNAWAHGQHDAPAREAASWLSPLTRG